MTETNTKENNQKEAVMSNNPNNSFFSQEVVKRGKDIALKTRFDTLIKNAGLSQTEFYERTGISRQYFYFISWGIWECPIEMKVKIAKVLTTDSSVIWQEERE